MKMNSFQKLYLFTLISIVGFFGNAAFGDDLNCASPGSKSISDYLVGLKSNPDQTKIGFCIFQMMLSHHTSRSEISQDIFSNTKDKDNVLFMNRLFNEMKQVPPSKSSIALQNELNRFIHLNDKMKLLKSLAPESKVSADFIVNLFGFPIDSKYKKFYAYSNANAILTGDRQALPLSLDPCKNPDLLIANLKKISYPDAKILGAKGTVSDPADDHVLHCSLDYLREHAVPDILMKTMANPELNDKVEQTAITDYFNQNPMSAMNDVQKKLNNNSTLRELEKQFSLALARKAFDDIIKQCSDVKLNAQGAVAVAGTSACDFSSGQIAGATRFGYFTSGSNNRVEIPTYFYSDLGGILDLLKSARPKVDRKSATDNTVFFPSDADKLTQAYLARIKSLDGKISDVQGERYYSIGKNQYQPAAEQETNEAAHKALVFSGAIENTVVRALIEKEKMLNLYEGVENITKAKVNFRNLQCKKACSETGNQLINQKVQSEMKKLKALEALPKLTPASPAAIRKILCDKLQYLSFPFPLGEVETEIAKAIHAVPSEVSLDGRAGSLPQEIEKIGTQYLSMNEYRRYAIGLLADETPYAKLLTTNAVVGGDQFLTSAIDPTGKQPSTFNLSCGASSSELIKDIAVLKGAETELAGRIEEYLGKIDDLAFDPNKKSNESDVDYASRIDKSYNESLIGVLNLAPDLAGNALIAGYASKWLCSALHSINTDNQKNELKNKIILSLSTVAAIGLIFSGVGTEVGLLYYVAATTADVAPMVNDLSALNKNKELQEAFELSADIMKSPEFKALALAQKQKVSEGILTIFLDSFAAHGDTKLVAKAFREKVLAVSGAAKLPNVVKIASKLKAAQMAEEVKNFQSFVVEDHGILQNMNLEFEKFIHSNQSELLMDKLPTLLLKYYDSFNHVFTAGNAMVTTGILYSNLGLPDASAGSTLNPTVIVLNVSKEGNKPKNIEDFKKNFKAVVKKSSSGVITIEVEPNP